MANFEFNEIFVNTKGGNPNPFATCSTTITEMCFEINSNNKNDVINYINENYINTPIQAPITKSIISLKMVESMKKNHDFAKYIVLFETTIYYN